MVLILTEIEIGGDPAHVRDVFLDFAKLSEWHQGHFKSVEVQSRDGEIRKGDKVTITMEGATFSGVILENSERELIWRGSIYPIFCGDHFFRFQPSETNPGSTTFVQGEEFTGLLSFLMRPLFGWGFGTKTRSGFEKLNRDLRSRVEGGT
ncbi:hypothetical protein WHR41_03639 [Cladosporium halotolerans]|uniref:SRPBCC family protein n=1 Tax=Cladosporium halotolerans TaxID=1052096 RepID=A0AB34KWG1_9PEZI